jgi:hypothetical protein
MTQAIAYSNNGGAIANTTSIKNLHNKSGPGVYSNIGQVNVAFKRGGPGNRIRLGPDGRPI